MKGASLAPALWTERVTWVGILRCHWGFFLRCTAGIYEVPPSFPLVCNPWQDKKQFCLLGYTPGPPLVNTTSPRIANRLRGLGELALDSFPQSDPAFIFSFLLSFLKTVLNRPSRPSSFFFFLNRCKEARGSVLATEFAEPETVDWVGPYKITKPL